MLLFPHFSADIKDYQCLVFGNIWPLMAAFTFRPECCSESPRNGVRLQNGIARWYAWYPLATQQQRVGREELFEGEPGRDPSRSLMYRVGMLVFSQGLPISLTFRFKVAAR